MPGLHAPVDHGPGPVLVTAHLLRSLLPLIQRPEPELLRHGRRHGPRGGQQPHVVLLRQESPTLLLVIVVPKLWRRLIDRRLDILEHRHVIVIIIVEVVEDLRQVRCVPKEVPSFGL